MTDRALGVALAVILLLAGLAVKASRIEHDAERIQTQSQLQAIVGYQGAPSEVAPQTKLSPPLLIYDKSKYEEAEGNGTEFWPALLGYRFKITDTLLVIFTGFLAWSTWGLHRSTVGLQSAAERQESVTNALFIADQRPWISIEENIYYLATRMV